MTKDEIVVGRGGRDYWTDLKLDTLPDVSREHFRLRRDPASGKFFLKDLSRLGTTINGEKAPSSIEFVDGEKRDRNLEAPVPATGAIGLADVVFLEFRSTAEWLRPSRPNMQPWAPAQGRSAGARSGQVRRNNEDALACDAERGIFLVVDGIGGQAAGEKAAEIAVETRPRASGAPDRHAPSSASAKPSPMANNEILRAAREQSRMAGHGLRADRGGAGERIGGGRPRGRFAPVPDPRRRDREDHPRPFAGGRARRQPAS